MFISISAPSTRISEATVLLHRCGAGRPLKEASAAKERATAALALASSLEREPSFETITRIIMIIPKTRSGPERLWLIVPKRFIIV
jgi:hypothetical protein